MNEYEPLTDREAFCRKWAGVLRTRSQLSEVHLHQLPLDMFAAQRGRDWRNCDALEEEDELFNHPDGRIFSVSFDDQDLLAYVAIFPDSVAADAFDFAYHYSIARRGEENVDVIVNDGNGAQIKYFNPPELAQLLRDLLKAFIHTPVTQATPRQRIPLPSRPFMA